ncbi:AAWKG family protein [Streptomyces sp. NPDC093675]|uniref:AAWKG family protein n=1 Tax=Streptomyces sp. NPDC093675 TaxID=3366049 RepID=UPI003811E81B
MASPTFDKDDYWAKAISYLTGYQMPSRKDLFKYLQSKEGIPLFRMDIQNEPMGPVKPEDYSAITGWDAHSGEDYDIVFYSQQHGAMTKHRARIVMIGLEYDEQGRGHIQGYGTAFGGGRFNGAAGEEWDSSQLGQYVGGPKNALQALLSDKHTTLGFSFSGLSVDDTDAVDLNSFEKTANAFDRATKFFNDQADVLAQWEKSLGSEDSSWRGKAAGVFWHLLHQLHQGYDGYVDQLGGDKFTAKNTLISGRTPTSLLGDAVAGAQRSLLNQGQVLQSAWDNWAGQDLQTPWRFLLRELDYLSYLILQDNVTKVMERETDQGTEYYPAEGFTTANAYGDFSVANGDAWKRVGQNAVDKWTQTVDEMLGTPAKQVIADLYRQWSDLTSVLTQKITTKGTKALSDSYQEDQAELDKENAQKDQDKLNDELDKEGKGLDDLGDEFSKGFKGLNDGLSDSLGGLGKGIDSGLGDLGDGFGDAFTKLNGNLGDLGKGLGGDLAGSFKQLNSGPDGGGLPSPDAPDSQVGSLNGDAGDGGLTGGTPSPLPLNTLMSDGAPTPTDPKPKASSLNGDLGLDDAMADTGQSKSIVNPDGSHTGLTGDGSLLTLGSDGGLTTFNPTTGDLTLKTPDGKNTTQHLNPGAEFTTPDGKHITLNSDGTLTTDYGDGNTTTYDPSTGDVTSRSLNGQDVTTHLGDPGGSDSHAFENPNHTETLLNDDGTLRTDFGEGTTGRYDPTTHDLTLSTPDGQTVHHLSPGDAFTNPDGSKTTLNGDGTLTTDFPDGSKTTFHPDSGAMDLTDPNGHRTSTDLLGGSPNTGQEGVDDLSSRLPGPNDLDQLNSLGGLGGHERLNSLDDLAFDPDLDTLGQGPGQLLDGGVGGSSLFGGDQPGLQGSHLNDLSSLLSGAGTDGQSADAGQGAQGGGNPASQPASPMGPMGPMGMGGAAGGKDKGERTRDVYAGGAVPDRRSGSRGSGEDEEADAPGLGSIRVATSSHGSPMYVSGEQDRPSTQSEGDWSDTDDVWGTGESGVPAVIG